MMNIPSPHGEGCTSNCVHFVGFSVKILHGLHGVSVGAFPKVGLIFTDLNVTGSRASTLISIVQMLRIQCVYYFYIDRAGMTQK